MWSLLAPTLAFATPLIFAAIGELVVERAGVVNIGIEGMMLGGALAAWAVDGWKGPVAGVAASILAAVLLAIPFAVATIGFAADQIVTGTGINLLALGLTGMIYQVVPEDVQNHVVGLNKVGLMLFTPLLALAVSIYLKRTRGGLELTAVGEAPRAADTAGVNVNARRLAAIAFGAACAGTAGAYLSIMFNRVFTENMTGGIGFLALAIVIFGRWHPLGVVGAGLFFGFAHAVANHVQTLSRFSPVTLRLFDMLPYLVSLAALAGVAGKSGAPAALGKAYVRQ